MFKQIRTPALAAAAVMLFAGTAHAGLTELTTNGDFETGDTSGWVSFPSPGSSFTATGVNPSSGSFAGSLFNPTLASAAIIKQANIGIGLVNPGDTIFISFDARGSGAVGGVAFAEFFSELSGGGVSASEILGGGPLGLNANPEVWTTFMFSATAGPDVSGGVTLQLTSTTGGAGGSVMDVFYDNVSVQVETAVVPIPAAVWLFASALGMLGLRKRRVA